MGFTIIAIIKLPQKCKVELESTFATVTWMLTAECLFCLLTHRYTALKESKIRCMTEATENGYNERGQGKHSATRSSGRLDVVPLLCMRNANNGQKQDFGNLMRVVDQKQDYHLEWPNVYHTSAVHSVHNATSHT